MSSYFKTENKAYLHWQSPAFRSPRGCVWSLRSTLLRFGRADPPLHPQHPTTPRAEGLQSPGQQVWPREVRRHRLVSTPAWTLTAEPQAGTTTQGRSANTWKTLPGGVLTLQCMHFLVRSDSKLWLNSSALMSRSTVGNGRKSLLIGLFRSC